MSLARNNLLRRRRLKGDACPQVGTANSGRSRSGIEGTIVRTMTPTLRLTMGVASGHLRRWYSKPRQLFLRKDLTLLHLMDQV